MGGACGTYGGHLHTRICRVNLQVIDHFQDLGVDGRVIIITFLHGLDRLICSGIDTLTSFPGTSTISSSSRFVAEGVFRKSCVVLSTRVGTLIVATIYLQLIQNRFMFRSFTVLQCSHQHCVQPVASDVEVVGYL